MDQDVRRFRQRADRENPGRHQQRRYSETLQRQAIDYWQSRRRDDGLRTMAAALGIAPRTLHRWIRTAHKGPTFRPIEVAEPRPSADTPPLVLTLTTEGPRVECPNVDAAARLLMLLQ